LLLSCFSVESIGLHASPSCWSSSGRVCRVQLPQSKPRWKQPASGILGGNKICLSHLVKSRLIRHRFRDLGSGWKVFLVRHLSCRVSNVNELEEKKDIVVTYLKTLPWNLPVSVFSSSRLRISAWRLLIQVPSSRGVLLKRHRVAGYRVRAVWGDFSAWLLGSWVVIRLRT
jgi:hypothetical protein